MFLSETRIDNINIEKVNKSVNEFIAEFNDYINNIITPLNAKKYEDYCKDNIKHLKVKKEENQKEYFKSLNVNKPENYLNYLLDTLITWKYIPKKLLNIK
jgi:hypothetical protein